MAELSAKGESTRTRILDCAEELFALADFDGVSIRAITKKAGLQTAMVHYHFRTKDDLFAAVIERRAAELNDARLESLSQLGRSPSIEQVIEAYTRPFLERSARGGAGWKSYSRLIAQVSVSPRWTDSIMATQFDPIAEQFVQHARSALPESSVDEIYWSFHFLVGAMINTFAETGRVDRLSKGRCKSTDLNSLQERMIPFLAAGFRALCVSKPASSGRRTGRSRRKATS